MSLTSGSDILPSGRTGTVRQRSGQFFQTVMSSTSSGPIRYSFAMSTLLDLRTTGAATRGAGAGGGCRCHGGCRSAARSPLPRRVLPQPPSPRRRSLRPRPPVTASVAAIPARSRAMRCTHRREEEEERDTSLRDPFRACCRIVRSFDGTAVSRRHGDAYAKDMPPYVRVGEHVVPNGALLVVDAVRGVERIEAAG